MYLNKIIEYTYITYDIKERYEKKVSEMNNRYKIISVTKHKLKNILPLDRWIQSVKSHYGSMNIGAFPSSDRHAR